MTYGVVQSNKTLAKEAAEVRQHEIAHEQNEARAKQKAYAEHLVRAAYDRAHPEVVAARKAAVKAEAERRVAAAKAEAHRQEIARQEQAQKNAAAKKIADVQRAADDARQAKENHPCDTMWTYRESSVDAYNSDRYQASYDASVSGLHYADECDTDDGKIVARGYLLVTKALSEKHLSSGDSEVDINQGITLLSSCQSTPGIYATQTAARCEREEDTAIRYKMQWEEDRYSSD